MQAYVCNYKEHWFTLRRIGHQWFNLNSVQSKPSFVTETYLSLYLKQLQQEGCYWNYNLCLHSKLD